MAASSAAPVFFDAKLEPPAGRVISGLGGTENLAAYEKIVAPHSPAMIAFDLPLDFTSTSPFLNQYRAFKAAHGYFIANIGLSFRGKEHDVAAGMIDPDVFVIADGLRDVDRPVLLRLGGRFNAPGAVYEPSAYIGAFRHVTDTCRHEYPGIAMVWDASARGLSDPHYMKWYPGDDAVDWWGVELDAPDAIDPEVLAFIDAAEHHRKPVLISASSDKTRSDAEALKWFATIFDLVRAHPTIQALSIALNARLLRSSNLAAYLKQQLADPRFIDATEAPSILRPKSASEER
ncbi:MAG TPA: hypothetical protein VMT64_07200 [Candidatus Binataceae bacterium]|nr:hypothetical protein [Candidatus Binataceae bacterium]